MMILPACAKFAASAAAPSAHATEQRLEEIAELAGLAAAEFETCIPIRRRVELLTGLEAAADLIIGCTLLGVPRDIIENRNLLKPLLRTLLLVDVGMVLARKLAICALDRIRLSVAFDAKDFIIVLIFHRLSIPPASPTS